jgi:hypothetical protein
MNKFRLFIFLFLLTFFSKSSFSQIEDSTTMSLGWVDIGVGLSNIYSKPAQQGINLGLSYNHYLDKFCYQIGFDGNSNIGSPTLDNINLDIGKRIFNRYYLISCFIGPAYMYGNTSANSENFTFHTIGINSNIQLIFKPFFWFGLGTELFADVCNKESAIGFRLVAHFTNINDKKPRKMDNH